MKDVKELIMRIKRLTKLKIKSIITNIIYNLKVGNTISLGITMVVVAITLFLMGFSVQLQASFKDTPNKGNTEKKEFTNESRNSLIITTKEFDFANMISKVESMMFSSPARPYLIQCEEVGGTIKELSEDSFYVVVEKLKRAYQVEVNVKASFTCEKYCYSIGNLENGTVSPSYFSLYYFDKMLILDFEGMAYSFYYRDSDEISALIENLNI